MKNKDFHSFNNDRILAARKRVIDLLYLIGSWEEQKQQKQKPWKKKKYQNFTLILEQAYCLFNTMDKDFIQTGSLKK